MAKSHSFSPSDAAAYGLHAAILIHHFQWWLDKNRHEGRNFFDGHTWTKSSYAQLAQNYSYLTAKEVRTAIDLLTAKQVVVKRSDGDGTANWYAFSDEARYLEQLQTPAPQGRPLPPRADPPAPQGKPLYKDSVPVLSSEAVSSTAAPALEDDPTMAELFGPAAAHTPKPADFAGLPELTETQLSAVMTLTREVSGTTRLTPYPDELLMWRQLFAKGLKLPVAAEVVREVVARPPKGGKPRRYTRMTYFSGPLNDALIPNGRLHDPTGIDASLAELKRRRAERLTANGV